MKKVGYVIAWIAARLIRSLLLILAYIVYAVGIVLTVVGLLVTIVLIAVGLLVTTVIVVVPVLLMTHGADAAKRLSTYSLIQRMKRDFWEEPY